MPPTLPFSLADRSNSRRYGEVRVVGIIADVGASAGEVLGVDIDPRGAGRSDRKRATGVPMALSLGLGNRTALPREVPWLYE